MKTKSNKIAALVTAIFVLNGCAGTSLRPEVNKQNKAISALTEKNIDVLGSVNDANARMDADNWIGDRRVKMIADDKRLPKGFTEKYSLAIQKPLTISEAAREITRLTGIAVRISADVQNTTTNASATATATTQTNEPVWGKTVKLDFEDESLTHILDEIASSLGISYEFNQDDQAIHFSRLITKIFNIDLIQGQSSQSISVGRTSSSSGGSSSNTASSTAQMTNTLDAWANMETMVKAALSPLGKVASNPSINKIIVTDNSTSMRAIEKIIESINVTNLKQIAFKVDVLSVASKNSNELGVNWNAVWNKLGTLSPHMNLTFNTPSGAAVSTSASAIGFGLLTPAGGSTNPFDGTTAMFQALQTVGKTTVVNTSSVVTMNNQISPTAITNSEYFIRSTTAATSAAGTGATTSAVGINQEELTTGYILNLLPSVLSTGEIGLQFSYDNSALTALETTVSAGQTLGNPKVSKTQTMQRVKMRVGTTMILSGFTRYVARKSDSGLPNVNVALGGVTSDLLDREDLVIMITPVSVN